MSLKNDYDFLTFVMFEQHRLWQGTADHRKKSVRKAEKFSNFRDFGTRALDDFKPHDIHDFFDSLTREGLSDNTVNHYAAMLTRVFNHAVNEEHITHAPKFTWKEVKTNARPLFFTEEQLEKMEAYFKETDDAYMTHFIVLGHQTGMRLGEITGLTRDSLEQDDTGATWVHLTDTKNGDERFVPLNERAQDALAALDYLPARYFEHTRFYRAWGRMRRDLLRNDDRYVFHTLRHTAATKMANDIKANSAVIGLMLGHRSEKTTRKYIKAKPSALQAIAAQMAAHTN